jgi:hypothetical protein
MVLPLKLTKGLFGLIEAEVSPSIEMVQVLLF